MRVSETDEARTGMTLIFPTPSARAPSFSRPGEGGVSPSFVRLWTGKESAVVPPPHHSGPGSEADRHPRRAAALGRPARWKPQSMAISSPTSYRALDCGLRLPQSPPRHRVGRRRSREAPVRGRRTPVADRNPGLAGYPVPQRGSPAPDGRGAGDDRRRRHPGQGVTSIFPQEEGDPVTRPVSRSGRRRRVRLRGSGRRSGGTFPCCGGRSRCGSVAGRGSFPRPAPRPGAGPRR